MTGTHRLLARTPRRVCFAGDWHGNATFAAGRVMSPIGGREWLR